jgi:hypothetical protein
VSLPPPPDPLLQIGIWRRGIALDGGAGGIRTHDPAQHRIRDFQSRSFDHSDTAPCVKIMAGAMKAEG